ncbi:hypothetical protein ETB97_002037 [Aspergillus alliaceus]|uniref:Uncharacterized protein n=1 Tax=Petromyces alliaceus TaxID=209559 RepID=A0A8H6A3S0_PETAA|nr:hypothetical protein ETB97_002037 [Aspergillus burnettii]
MPPSSDRVIGKMVRLDLAASVLQRYLQSHVRLTVLWITVGVATGDRKSFHHVIADRAGPGSILIVAGYASGLAGYGIGVAAHDGVALGRDGGGEGQDDSGVLELHCAAVRCLLVDKARLGESRVALR